MKRKWGFLAVAITAAFLVSSVGSAFGAAYVSDKTGGVPWGSKIATELMPTAGFTKDAGLEIFYNAPIIFQANDLLTMTLSNMATTSTALKLCGPNGAAAAPMQVADYVGAVDATNGVSTLIFRMRDLTSAPTPPALTDELWVVDAANCAVYGAWAEATGAANALKVKFPQLAAGATTSISTSATTGFGLALPAATASATFWTAQKEFTAAVPGGVKSDLITFTSQTKKILVGGVEQTFDSGNVITLTDTLTPATQDLIATIVPADGYVYTISNATLSGVKAICFDDAAGVSAAGCSAAAKAFTLNAAAGTATFTITGAANNAALVAAVTGKPISFVFDGTTSLTVRTYKVSSNMNFASALEQSGPVLAPTSYFDLFLSATQFVIPLVKTSAGTDTFIKVQTKNTDTGANGISVDFVAANGTVHTFTPTPATVTAGVPLTIKGSDIAAYAAANGFPVDGTNGFFATVTINAPAADVVGYANYSDSTGAFRRIPVKVVNGNANE